MARQLGAIASLAEDEVQFPATTWQITNISNSSSRRSNTTFWSLWAPGMHTHSVHTYLHANTQSISSIKLRAIEENSTGAQIHTCPHLGMYIYSPPPNLMDELGQEVIVLGFHSNLVIGKNRDVGQENKAPSLCQSLTPSEYETWMGQESRHILPTRTGC